MRLTSTAEEWSSVAGAWDETVDDIERLKSQPTTALVDAVAVRAGDRVLELAAGPGGLGDTWSALVGPSAPQFQLLLWLSPSRLRSPLAALCLWLWLAGSRNVNSSCDVTKLILA